MHRVAALPALAKRRREGRVVERVAPLGASLGARPGRPPHAARARQLLLALLGGSLEARPLQEGCAEPLLQPRARPHARPIRRHADDAVPHPVHDEVVRLEEALRQRGHRRDERDRVVHVEATHQIPDRDVLCPVAPVAPEERVTEPALVAPHRKPGARRRVGGRARAAPQPLDRRALRLLQPPPDLSSRRCEVVVGGARHLAAVGGEAGEDEERHAKLLAAVVEEARRGGVKGVVVRRVGLEHLARRRYAGREGQHAPLDDDLPHLPLEEGALLANQLRRVLETRHHHQDKRPVLRREQRGAHQREAGAQA
mmetsp:Transcript_7655/g.22788  ORF Transcript_7655/g.22788 Transcript_7655/m.22788 type:complete len:312 (+) Transcript_7655:314-1249(+)